MRLSGGAIFSSDDARLSPANQCRQWHGAVDRIRLAFSDEEFAWKSPSRSHIVGLNLARRDYNGHPIHFNLENPEWVLSRSHNHSAQMSRFSSRICAIFCRRFAITLAAGERRLTALLPVARTRNDARSLKGPPREDKKTNHSLMYWPWTGIPIKTNLL